MPSFEFPYLGFQIAPSDPFPKGQAAFRPMAVAELTASTGKRLRCLVCTDSGADSCVFPSSFASVLGLDILTMKKHLTAGGWKLCQFDRLLRSPYRSWQRDSIHGIRRVYAGPGFNRIRSSGTGRLLRSLQCQFFSGTSADSQLSRSS